MIECDIYSDYAMTILITSQVIAKYAHVMFQKQK